MRSEGRRGGLWRRDEGEEGLGNITHYRRCICSETSGAERTICGRIGSILGSKGESSHDGL